MAQPGVVREPSMEEILASIRRIIESNEPQAENALPQSMPPVYAEDEIDDGDIDIVTEMAANDRGRPHQADAASAMEADRGQERSLSLADVAARVRAASARPADADVRQVQPAATVAAPAQKMAPPAAQEPAVASAPRLQPAPLPEFSPQPARAEKADAPAAAPPPFAMESAPDPVEGKAAPVTPEAPGSLPARVEALISEEAGAQVARSFNDLAAVFDGIRNRSVEDMAQEMLRPMLQEWLDDNLPTLVERLVREEIERVARGPRR